MYSRGELLALIKLNTTDPERAAQAGLTTSDAKLMEGALSYRNKPVDGAMTPLSCLYSLPIDTVFDKDTFLQVLQKGHTRIPVFDKTESNIVSVMYCKNLLGIGFEHKISLREVVKAFKAEHRMVRIPRTTSCGEAFELCKKERQQMLIVTESPTTSIGTDNLPAIGIITMEDIVEMIIQEDIVGEYDEFANRTIGGQDGMSPLLRQNSRRIDSCALLKNFEPPPSAKVAATGTLPGAVIE
eukprot:TRINITY_DN29078_c0_g1_i3.p1 TRINITY_DN29078_c0_g1~~TRINITY_DN29078_c0_g1_i3.p1  ORF type:complete len:241 (-),score=43.38 TRINITY_DN29078_c0_g1_i3:197-919(-)